MRYCYTLIILFLTTFTRAEEATENELLDNLLLQELGEAVDGVFPASWAYANEGGVIRYGELDIVGDNRKEIIFSRSTDGFIQGSEVWAQKIYFQPEGKDQYVQLEGEVFFGSFQKKEDGISVFLKASEGNSFSTADEPAFTRKLIIQKVSEKGVVNEASIIDGETEQQLQEMWKSALLSNEVASVTFMEDLGFEVASPTFKWISLRDYLSDGEWKDDDVNEWSALTEFSVNGMLWNVSTDSISPLFMDFVRQVHELNKKSEIGILPEQIDFPEGYLTPRAAYLSLTKKQKPVHETKVRERDGNRNTSFAEDALKEKKTNPFFGGSSLGIFALIILALIAGLIFWNKSKGSSV